MIRAGKKSIRAEVCQYPDAQVSADKWREPNRSGDPAVVKTVWIAIYPNRAVEWDENHQREAIMKCHIKTDWIGGKGVTAGMFFRTTNSDPTKVRLFDIISAVSDDVTRMDATFICEEKRTGV